MVASGVRLFALSLVRSQEMARAVNHGSAMGTAGPAAWPALAFFKHLARSLDMLSPCFRLFY
jgi:hypothetical protein